MPKHENPIEETLLALQASLGVLSLAHESTEDPYAEQALSAAMATLATAHALVEKHLDDPHAISEPRRTLPTGMGQEPDEECPHERAQEMPNGTVLCLDCAESLSPEEGEEEGDLLTPEERERIAGCNAAHTHGNPFRYCVCGWIEPHDAC